MKFNFKDIEIHFEIHGEGEPLLFLNGIMMSTKSWAPFIEPISQHYQLILMDFIDQGQSGLAKGEYKHDLQVEVVYALLAHLEIDQVNLFGISYGGEIALQFAISHPDKLKSLIISNTCAETTYWLKEIGRSWIEAAPNPLAYYLTTIPIIYSPNFFNERREWMENRKSVLVEVFNADFLEKMERLTISSEGYDVRDKLSEIACPTLIMGATEDMVTPLDQQKFLHKQITDSRFVIIPECGHASMYEKPTEFLTNILGFLAHGGLSITI